MKVISINSLPYGSTGNITKSIMKDLNYYGNSGKSYFGKWKYTDKYLDKSSEFSFGFYLENLLHAILGRFTGLYGFFSIFGTIQLINILKKEKPEILHLHNLHLWNINIPMLFSYIKKNNIPVVWTLHDCWAFTGKCTHFTMVGCEKWMDECHDCPQCNKYPKSFIDSSKVLYRFKRKWFTGIKKITIVTPSKWLSALVKQSYLKEYNTIVINNGIDLNIFKPRKSNFREEYNCKDKIILLGVAFGWGREKGLDIFVELSKVLDDKYQIILVGIDDNIKLKLPQNIISISRLQNQEKLAEIYTASDIFINPTREEVFGLVNIESLACGTPVITFKSGGSPECIDTSCGIVVDKDDINEMIKAIETLSNNKIDEKLCIERARLYNRSEKNRQYIELYKKMILG